MQTRSPVLAALLVSAALPAQQLVELPVRSHFPAMQLPGSPEMAFGDVNGDGATDVYLDLNLFVNDGFGRFIDETLARLPSSPNPAAAFSDVDGDGDDDIITFSGELYTNTNGIYARTPGVLPTPPQSIFAVLPLDVDVDGDEDLLVGGADTSSYPYIPLPIRLWRNDGGTFTDVTATQMPGTPIVAGSVAAGDVDGDGDVDLVAGFGRNGAWSGAGANHLYLNDGSGTFTDASMLMPQHNDITSGTAIGDLDGDGDLDIAFSNDFGLSFGGPAVSRTNRIYLNDGSANFTDLPSGYAPSTTESEDVEFLDYDGDGRLDVIFGGTTTYAGTLKVLRNITPFPTAPRFALDGSVFVTEAPQGASIGLLDANGDGAPDLLTAGAGFNALGCPGDAIEAPATVSQLFLSGVGVPGTLRNMSAENRIVGLPGESAAIACADFNGDGFPDLVLGKAGERNQAMPGNGTGEFFSATAFGGRTATTSLATGDIDGDGNLDLVEGTSAGSRLYLGDGRGGFTDVTLSNVSPPGDAVNALVVGDIDGDGDTDLITAGSSARVYENIGGGRLVEAPGRLPTPIMPVQSLVLVDLDGDGDIDLGAAAPDGFRTPGTNAIFLNNGRGRFTLGNPLTPTGDSAMVARDIDADGDVDLVLGKFVRFFSGPSSADLTILINDGTANFTDETATRLPGNPNAGGDRLAIGDIDVDGDLDIWCLGNIVCPSSTPMHLLLNDGMGNFALDSRSTIDGPLGSPRAWVLADIDLDRDPDLVATTGFFSFPTPDRVLVNVTRQLWQAIDAVTGSDLVVEIMARPGYATSQQTAFSVVGAALLSTPVRLPGLGLLRVDPSASETTVTPLPSATGRGEIRLPIPANPALIGLPFHVQSLIANDRNLSDASISNLVSDRVRS